MTPTRPSRFCAALATLLAAAVLLGLTTHSALAQSPTVIYVNAAAAPGGNGTSWLRAYRELQSALDTAAPIAQSGQSVDVWVAAGTYLPTKRRNPLDPRSASFSLQTRVNIYGGFAGTETREAQRDWTRFTTTLSGDLDGNDGPPSSGFANFAGNAASVVYANDVQQPCRLDGFVITGGNSDGQASTDTASNQGGGIYSHRSSHSVANCLIFRNSAIYGGGWNCTPGAIDFISCWFHANRATNQGGAFFTDNSAPFGTGQSVRSISFTSCVFSRNTGPFAVGIVNNYPAAFVNCTMADNVTPDSVTLGGGDSITLDNCVIWGSGTISGGGSGTIRNTIIQGGLAAFSFSTRTASNVLAVDPRFASPFGPDNLPGTLDDDYRLSFGSPAIDSGDNALLPAGSLIDVAKRRRIAVGVDGGNAVVDRGAHEYRSPVATDVLFVNRSATGANDGSTWQDAFTGPQALANALAVTAQFPGAYREIWIARGTYTPAPPGGSRSASFNLQNNLALYGGFLGTETDPAQRPPIQVGSNDATDPTLATVLSGNLNNDANDDINNNDNSYHVVTSSASTYPILDGVTITGGNGTGTTGFDSFGGGCFIIDAPGGADFRSVTFANNRSRNIGGGLSLWRGSKARLSDCAFVGNSTGFNPSDPSGLYGPGLGGGGAIHLDLDNTYALLRRCQFRDNRAAEIGGALAVTARASLDAVDCTFLRNSSGLGGGAAYVGYGANASAQSRASFLNCGFYGNMSSDGSAIQAYLGGRVVAANCAFVGNRALGVAAIYIVNTLDGTLPSQGLLTNCTIVGNQGRSGTPANEFAGVFIENGNTALAIDNSIIWGNGPLGGNPTATNQIGAINAGPITISRTLAQNWSGAFGGIGNSSADPLFIRMPNRGTDNVWGTLDDDYGDVRLSSASPATDSGNSSIFLEANGLNDRFDLDNDGNTTEALPFDLAGFPRFVDDPAAPNTGLGTPPIDRGAYERPFDCPTCPGPRDWIAIGGGSYSQPGNWTPSTPNSTHDTTYRQALTYTVNLPTASTISNRSAAVDRGSPTWSIPSSTTFNLTSSSTQALTIASEAFRSAALTITGGGLLKPNSASIANDPDASGALTLTGTNTRLSITNGDLAVGFLGAGSFSVLSGAKATTRTASLGDQPGAIGTALIDGPGSSWTVPFGLLIASGSATVSNTGSISTTVGTILLQDGLLTGNSSVAGPVFNFGTVAPGLPTGTLTINGDYTQLGQIDEFGSSAGQLMIQLPASGSGAFDRLQVNGLAELSGGLSVSTTSAADLSLPPAGLAILRARDGFNLDSRFDVAFLPRAADTPSGQAQYVRVVYQPDATGGPAAAEVRLLTGDLNSNVDVSDPVQETAASGTPTAALARDLNNDGLSDLILTAQEPGGGQLLVFINRGTDGSGNWLGFAGAIAFPIGQNPSDIAAGDLDDDGFPDLAIANTGSDTVSVFRNTTAPDPGTGALVFGLTLVSTIPTDHQPTGVAIAPLDGRANVSIIVACAANTLTAYTFDTTPRGGSPTRFNNPPTPKPITVRPNSIPWKPRDIDVDGDARVDLAVLSRENATVLLYHNLASPGADITFSDPYAVATGRDPADLQVASLDNGPTGPRPSVITANRGDGTISVLTNQVQSPADFNIPAFQPLAPAVNIPAGDDPRSIAPIDIDSDTDGDLAVLTRVATTSRVRIFRNDFLVDGLRVNDQPTLVSDRDVPEVPTTDQPLFVVAARLVTPARTDLITILPAAAQRGGSPTPNIRPRLVTSPSCPADYNRDGFLNLDDLGDFITDFYNDPPIPAGLQPDAPTYPGTFTGFATPCPSAPDAPAPYSPAAYRASGYRVGFSADGANACPASPDQPFPNLDNLGDFITAYYTAQTDPACATPARPRVATTPGK